MNDDPVLKNALAGDINAFQKLWAEFQPQLKSYLYRLVADRSDADDLAHDCFVKSFDRITSFRAESSLKT
jgi:RNA polymerase sigma-70 factor (ECF subfamily)